MDFARQLAEIGAKHSRAHDELRAVEAERDDLIRRAHRQGQMSTRAIATAVGMSHQRVGQIVQVKT